MDDSRRRAAGMLGLLIGVAGLGACAAPVATTPAGASTRPGTTLPPTTAAPATSGNGSSPLSGGITIDACALLTSADIKEITGFAVAEVIPDPKDTIFPSACEWRVEGAAWQVVLGVASPGGQATWNSLVPYTQGDAVTGIGDEAFLAEMGGDLMVREGDTFIDVQYIAVGDAPDTQDRLAKRVLEHLP